MKHRLSLLFLLLFSVVFQSLAQKDDFAPGDTTTVGKPVGAASNINAYVPKVIPPSPDAASLGKYGDVPVELSKGTPSITIPIYEVQSGSLKLPITLSYHASGVKVNDIASSVGLSWTLNAGGALTRVVNGLPDEFSGGFRSMAIPQKNTNEYFCLLGKIAAYDGERNDGTVDDYYYNYNQQAGRYTYANKRASQQQYFSPVPVTIPYRPVKISGNTFTEPDGTIYAFGANYQPSGRISYETTYQNSGATNYQSTWYLSTMVSANRIDTIYFEYTSPVLISNLTLWSTTLAKTVKNGTSTSYDYLKDVNGGSISTVYLNNIYFKNGKVTFNYSNNDRQDLPNAKRLTSIYIYSKDAAGNYSELKHFDLEQSYFACQDGYTQGDQPITSVSNHSTGSLSHYLKRLRLDKVTEKSGSSSLPPHQFSYYESETLKLPLYGSLAQDFWGFYNGASSNKKLLYFDTNGSAEPSNSYGANRNTNFTYAVLGTLKSITYPTGGRSEFEFEPHATGTTPADQGGGIRIKSVTNYEGAVQLTKKAYTYPGAYITNNIYSGNMSGFASAFTSTSSENSATCQTDTYVRSYYPEGYQFMIGSNSGSSMEYNQVEEYVVDGSNNPLGKTVRKFKQATDATNSMFPFKTVRNGWMRGHLEEENIYNSANQLVSRLVNVYKTVETDSIVRNIGAKPKVSPLMNNGSGCILVGYPNYCSNADPASTTSHT